MSSEGAEDASVAMDDFNSIDTEAGSSKAPTIECLSSNGELMMCEIRSASEVLTRIEIDLACSSEKLVNLHILMMNVATLESEFDSFVLEKENKSDTFIDKALEFDLLSGILDSEVTELCNNVAVINSQLGNAREVLSSYVNLPEIYVQMEEKLHDSEKTLQQSQDQISEMKMQSSMFQQTLSCFGLEENGSGTYNDEESIEFEKVLDINSKINMQTVEQQRHILRMLAKSLAKEMDLEKKLSESRQIEDELKLKLYNAEQEVICIEEEATDLWERLVEADNAAEVLMGISKELLAQTQLIQFNLKNSTQREDELRSNLEDKLSKMGELESVIEHLKERVSIAETDAENLKTTNMKLNEELEFLKGRGGNIGKVENRESEILLQKAVAEASQEKENMLNSIIQDMGNLIENLKLKVSKAENRADSVEDKCVILSENNDDLNEEICILRSKVEALEASRNQMESSKVTTTRDIGITTKVIENLVTQLSIERERLHKQITSLVKENKILALKLKQTNHGYSVPNEINKADDDLTAAAAGAKGSKEHSTTSFEDNNTKNGDLNDDDEDAEVVRRIDAGMLKFKHVVIALLILLISIASYNIQTI